MYLYKINNYIPLIFQLMKHYHSKDDKNEKIKIIFYY